MTDLDHIKWMLHEIYGLKLGYYTLHDDGVVDIHKDLTVGKQMARFDIQFGHAYGNFHCRAIGLESLEGAPHTVDGYFICNNNKLTSLKGAPQHVGQYFACARNQLTSLEGAPQYVGSGFFCGGNKLKNLLGLPTRINGKLNCHENPLTSLEGMPSEGVTSLMVSYDPHLPVLRALQAEDGVDLNPEIYLGTELHTDDVEKVINDPKWMGKGKKGSLMCAAALIRAGYEGNAKW